MLSCLCWFCSSLACVKAVAVNKRALLCRSVLLLKVTHFYRVGESMDGSTLHCRAQCGLDMHVPGGHDGTVGLGAGVPLHVPISKGAPFEDMLAVSQQSEWLMCEPYTVYVSSLGCLTASSEFAVW